MVYRILLVGNSQKWGYMFSNFLLPIIGISATIFSVSSTLPDYQRSEDKGNRRRFSVADFHFNCWIISLDPLWNS